MSRFTILHTNDLHDGRSAFPVIRSYMGLGKTVYFDSGDAIGGSNTLFFPREPVYDEMNRAGCRAMAMGNREFHYLRAVLAMRRRAVKFPILAANLRDLTGKASHCWDDFLMTDIEGVRTGVTGLSPVQFPEHSLLTRLTGFQFLPPSQALGTVLDRMRQQGARMTVLLSHLGLRDDMELARHHEVDLILGGHSHTMMDQPVVVEGTHIVQSGAHGRYAGKLDVLFQDGRIVYLDYDRVPIGQP